MDRHGLRPRDDKMRSDAVCGSITTRSCHCKERAERGTRQSIVSCTLPGAQWIATGYAMAMTRCEVMQCAVLLQHTLCHCELEDSPMRQSIVSCTLPGAQWIATGYALAMTRCEVMSVAVRLQAPLVIARKERSEDAAIHRVLVDSDDLSLRFLEHSGSPRATPSR